ncbi:MAG: peptide deformylase [Actinomycetota bacterium]
MAVLSIRTFGDPILRHTARAVEEVDDVHRRLSADMLETMRVAPGVGLAGNQVGVLERIFTWELDDAFGTIINPVITRRSRRMFTDEEGCLSLPGLVYPVERHLEVRVEGSDENGDRVEIDAEEHVARVFQHEIDHLDGILFIDRLPDDLRREARRILTDQALGLPPPRSSHVRASVPSEETL